MKEICVLDIGSSKIVRLIASKTRSGLTSVRDLAEFSYDGFYDSTLLSPDTFADDLAAALAFADPKPKTVYVGVPCDFLDYRIVTVEHDLGSFRTVTRGDVDELFAAGNHFSDRGTLITTTASGYILDESRYVVDPIGEQCSHLRSNVTYVFCNREFAASVEAALTSAGVQKANFVSSFWATCVSMLDEHVRSQGAVVVDMGYSSTSAAYVIGEGFEAQITKPIGYASAAGALMDRLSLETPDAISILKDINLGLDDDEKYWYNKPDDTAVRWVYASTANMLVKGLLDEIVQMIDQCRASDQDPVYFCGGAIGAIKGAAAYLGNAARAIPNMLAPDVPMYSKPRYASAFGTFEIACKTERTHSPLARLLDKIRR